MLSRSPVLLCDPTEKKWRSLYCHAIVGANDPGDLWGGVARWRTNLRSANLEICPKLDSFGITEFRSCPNSIRAEEKHRKVVADILADLTKLKAQQAVKIPLSSLNGEKMQNLRSALNRVTRGKNIPVVRRVTRNSCTFGTTTRPRIRDQPSSRLTVLFLGGDVREDRLLPTELSLSYRRHRCSSGCPCLFG
jgi:hypothetical protein